MTPAGGPEAARALVPMTPQAYERYLAMAVEKYAASNVASRRWPEDGALGRAKAVYAELLPRGIETPDNYLYEITGGPGAVGMLWFAAMNRNGMRSAFVYDVFVYPEFRRQGHATRAFRALEELVGKLGLSSIGLHVFSFNTEARAMYAKLGYTETGVNMSKLIGGV